MVGKCMTKSYCRGQATIALSSGEAEYYGLVSVASEALGLSSLAKDYGVLLKIRIHMDATAGAAIGSRRGLGKVKHINTIFLRVQELVTSGQVAIGKIHTSMNFADLLTKPVSGPLLKRLMDDQGFTFPSTRANLALTA